MITDLMKIQLNHCSVREFTDKPIDTNLLKQLLRCGQSAASSSFIQAYSVVRVKDVKHREHIAKLAGGQQWIVQAPEFLVFCADLYRVEQACLAQGQGVLQGQTEHFLAASVDVALMAQNVLLAAESAGLGGVFIGGIRNDPATLSELLALPTQVYPVFGLCLGYPDQDGAVKPRFPVDVILHESRYQADAVPAQIEAYDAHMQAYYQSRQQNSRLSDWSEQTAKAIQGKLRPHVLPFLQAQGFLRC